LGGDEGKDKTRHGDEKAIDDKEEEKTNTSSSETRWYFTTFTVLGVVGSLAGGAAGIAIAVNDSKAGQRQLEEMQRHNRAMEGPELYLAPYKLGQGLST